MNASELARLGQAQVARRDFRGALSSLEALRSLAPSVPLLTTMAGVHRKLCQVDAARACLEQALVLEPNPAQRLRRALMLPPMMGSQADIEADRTRLHAELATLDALSDSELHIPDPLGQVATPTFYLAYHGHNDRALQQQVARLLRRACPSLTYTAPHCARWTAAPLQRATGRGGRRIRVGFLSSHLFSHTIGRLNRQLIERLPRDRFEVSVFFVGKRRDDFAGAIADAADHSVVLPDELAPARALVAARELDVLYFTDIGMDPFSYWFAFSRCAPIQCVTWGHPVTTGLDTVDWFVSGRSMEQPDSHNHYSEQLVELPDPIVCYPRPEPPDETASFGLPPAARAYLCLQNLFKLHPDFDAALAGIVARDPGGHLLLQEPEVADWKALLLERLRRHHPDVAARTHFLPMVKRGAYLARLAAGDVVLDPFHFGGGQTTLEALSMGQPVVTLPGGYLRGRLSLAFYRTLGVDAPVARDPEHYVELAVGLANNPERRRALHDEILARLPRLFDVDTAVTEHAAFFERAILARAEGAAPPE